MTDHIIIVPKQAAVSKGAAKDTIVFVIDKNYEDDKKYMLVLTREQVKQIADAANKLLE